MAPGKPQHTLTIKTEVDGVCADAAPTCENALPWNRPMIPRVSDPDPERSIVYLKEKLECGCDSFDGSAAYNLRRARLLRSALAILSAIACICIISRFVSDDHGLVCVANSIAIVSGVLVSLLMLLDHDRDYSFCASVHAYAAVRMKQIEKKVAFLEHTGAMLSKADVEEFYHEYRSVYDDTNMTLHSKRKMLFPIDPAGSTLQSETRQPPFALRPAGWETRGL